MVFSSPLFLFLFLPLVFCFYAAGRSTRAKNLILLLASLIFYAWGEGSYILLLLASIAFNHYGTLFLSRQQGRTRALCCAGLVAANLATLVYFKYAAFLLSSLGAVAGLFSWTGDISVPEVQLPLGISFFTFQALSYVIDVARRTVAVQPKLTNTALYIALFPQLVAGPIVRYTDLAVELHERSTSLKDCSDGALRFAIGLFKKVCIANPLGEFADFAYGLPSDHLSGSIAWLAALSYMFQIYFDFSGYSDMAIGLGRIFGFRFPENFLHPYASRSITEFWRRWHVTLSTWFRDYLYIPLGGSRGSNLRTYSNLLIVFVLCGLWHGASWTFLAWGLYHGFFLIVERVVGLSRIERLPSLGRLLYTLAVVLFGWVLFRAESFPQVLSFLSALLGQAPQVTFDPRFLMYFTNETLVVLIAGAALSFPWNRWTESEGIGWMVLRPLCVAALLLLCSAKLAIGSYNPFIYFRF